MIAGFRSRAADFNQSKIEDRKSGWGRYEAGASG
jgi:hypothetical protein